MASRTPTPVSISYLHFVHLLLIGGNALQACFSPGPLVLVMSDDHPCPPLACSVSLHLPVSGTRESAKGSSRDFLITLCRHHKLLSIHSRIHFCKLLVF
ncbi:hypothetical protein CPB86DRAFT_781724 [Serendipita vermifera]|nr:hypothetical protein CPB86DRAFT_781724 [Serendipita vermifera]